MGEAHPLPLLFIMLIRNRIEEKVKEWMEEVKKDKERRLAETKRRIGDLSNEIGEYFKAKARDRKYFY